MHGHEVVGRQVPLQNMELVSQCSAWGARSWVHRASGCMVFGFTMRVLETGVGVLDVDNTNVSA